MRKYRLDNSSMSMIKKMELLATQMWWVVSLSQWIPDYKMPQKLIDEVSKILQEWEWNKYTPVNGILELRENLSGFYNSYYGAHFWVNEVLITSGAIEAINSFLLTISTDKNDEIILLDPSYASYNNAIKIAGSKLVYCPIEKNLELDVEKLKSSITNNTKAIIICNPNNPTGGIIESEKIREILEYIKETDIYLVCDEVYGHFLLEENLDFVSATTHFEEYKKNLVVINSWSKTFSITGWRIWFMIAENALIQEVMKIQDSLITCAPSFAQYWVARSLDIIPTRIPQIVSQIKKARNIVVTELENMGEFVELEIPKAGYYIFCKFKYTNDDYHECMKILEKAKVSVVPGSAFWKWWIWYFRICFWRELSTLKEGMKRLKKYFETNPHLTSPKGEE